MLAHPALCPTPEKGASDETSCGFTLIELPIVATTIAILAAVAVPNFLEAQTQAQVSRLMADPRTIATALESYQVSTNACPVD